VSGLTGLRRSLPSCWVWSSTSATGFGGADGADGEGLLGGAPGAGALGVVPGWAPLWPDVPPGDPGPRLTADDGVEPPALVAPDAGGADPPPGALGRAGAGRGHQPAVELPDVGAHRRLAADHLHRRGRDVRALGELAQRAEGVSARAADCDDEGRSEQKSRRDQ